MYYIKEKNEGYVVDGFKSKEDAEFYIWSNPYLKNYDWQYSIEYWGKDIAYGVVYSRDSAEHGGTVFMMFETWDEAVDWVEENRSKLIKDFNFDDDIFQIDTMVKE